MAKRAYTFAKATRVQMDEQSILTDSQKNGGLNIDVKDLAKKDELDKKFVTFYYNIGSDDYPDSTYEEIEEQYSRNQDGLRLKTFVAADSVFLYAAKRWDGSKITFSGVLHGELIEATVNRYTNSWTLTRKAVAYAQDLSDEVTAREEADSDLAARLTAIENFLNGKKFLLADDQ